MPLTRIAADAIGVVTISLVSLTAILGLVCIYRSLYFQLQIRRRGFAQLNYFNGPWIARIALILVAIWWGFGEIVRLTFLKEKGSPFSSQPWQKSVCKFYVLSNLGFAEPSMFLMLAFLLHAALQKRQSDTLSQRWNRKTISYVLFSCLPIFIMQFVLILVGPMFNNEKSSKRTKMSKFFTCTYSLTNDSSVCTYPLLSTIVLGIFYVLLISCVTCVGTRLLSLVINKGLRRRVYVLMSSVILFLPFRVLLLGFSVLPRPGNLVYEAIVFLAFLMLLFCTMVGMCMLVYFPVADSLALRDTGHIEIEGMPFDDYYYDGASLIANQSHQDTGRNSDASTKPGSISFRTMIKDESPQTEGIGDVRFFARGSLYIGSPSGSPPLPGRPMVPLREVPTI
ncbi:uncharacterized protein LOC103704773 [Phoenix dactylifera]|uniref:Uncharacterized protein LOC103704773 n=1 Tax=Phoenix dactylifera TaxID=42345 RepID=A0A8B7BVV5_PHODC|nr:uncharacterized protein LOC103704773 [Phoenix dactylifera]